MSWDYDRDPVIGHDEFNRLNDVALFTGPVFDMYRRVSGEGLKSMMDSGRRFVLVDALPTESYEKEHICGAVNIPVESMERDAPAVIGGDDTIVVYSCSRDCAVSAVAADKLFTLGFEDIFRYDGGLEDWKMRGYCVEGKGKTPVHGHIEKRAA